MTVDNSNPEQWSSNNEQPSALTQWLPPRPGNTPFFLTTRLLFLFRRLQEVWVSVLLTTRRFEFRFVLRVSLRVRMAMAMHHGSELTSDFTDLLLSATSTKGKASWHRPHVLFVCCLNEPPSASSSRRLSCLGCGWLLAFPLRSASLQQTPTELLDGGSVAMPPVSEDRLLSPWCFVNAPADAACPGLAMGFYSENGFWEGFSEGVLRRGFPEGAKLAPSESATP